MKTVMGSNPSCATSKMLKKLSVICSIYDGDLFIDQFLEDIEKQTIFNDSEIIIINANSPGNEETKINKWMSNKTNVKYIKTSTRIGIYEAWNIGVKIANTEFLTNANVDDRRHQKSWEIHIKHIESEVIPKIDVVYGQTKEVNIPNITFDNCKEYEYLFKNDIFDVERQLSGYNQPHNNPVWRKSLHDKIGLFNEKYTSVSDWEFWVRATKAKAVFKVIKIPLSVYYRNPKGLSTAEDRKEIISKEMSDVFTRMLNGEFEIDA